MTRPHPIGCPRCADPKSTVPDSTVCLWRTRNLAARKSVRRYAGHSCEIDAIRRRVFMKKTVQSLPGRSLVRVLAALVLGALALIGSRPGLAAPDAPTDS